MILVRQMNDIKDSVKKNEIFTLLAYSLDDSANISLRRSTVNTYIAILLSSSKTNILQYPDVFIQIMSWILGEYGYLADKMSVEAILEKICQLILKKDSSTIGGDIEMR